MPIGFLNKFMRMVREGYGIVFKDQYQDAEAYETLMRTFWGRGVLARHVVDLMYEYVPLVSREGDRKSHILDLGAGTGIVSRELEKRGYKVCAADINPTVLEHIRLQNPHIERVVCDFNDKLPFDDNQFDGVTTVWANRYITRQGLYIFLKEVKRVLKPGGVFLWPIFPADTLMWKMKNGVTQITDAESLTKMMQDYHYSEATKLDDLFYKNMFSFKLPPHTVPVYIVAKK
jgi:SAM-dependent methyltransferase